MPKSAVLFGSIGSVAETSDIQRRAYNQALKEAGLDWEWDPDVYSDLLHQAGGKDRLTQLAAATNTRLSSSQIDAIHARKTEIACAEIVGFGVALRPGVAELIRLAKDKGLKTAFVTTTYQPNIDAIFAGSNNILSPDDFDHIVSRDHVAAGKPSPDAYHAALKALGLAPADALAIEDTANSVMSAKRAGLDVIATPGALTSDQDFWQADLVVENLAGSDGGVDPRVTAMLA